MIRPALFLLALLLAAAGAAQEPAPPKRTQAPAAAQAGSAYSVGGIKVDVSAANAQAARFAAYRIAQRKAWPQLWSRLTGNPANQAPRLSDGQLDSVVSGIETQGERFSLTRYIATLGVVFDRSRVTEYFGDVGGALQSPPMLLLPIWNDGGARIIHQAKTPWADAWARFRENVTPIDYVQAPGTAADNLLLTGWQAQRPGRDGWRNILTRYDTVDVLMAEARIERSWPGGPLRGVFSARHGPDARLLGRFAMRANGEDGLVAMLDSAVQRIDGLYAAALQDGRLASDARLALDMAPIIAPEAFTDNSATAGQVVDDALIMGSDLLVITPDGASLAAIENALRQVPGVLSVTATSVSLGGTSRLLLSHAGPLDALVPALAARGLTLEAVAGGTLLRRGQVPPPPDRPGAVEGAARPLTAPPVDLLPRGNS